MNLNSFRSFIIKKYDSYREDWKLEVYCIILGSPLGRLSVAACPILSSIERRWAQSFP